MDVVAVLLDVHINTVRGWIKQGYILAYKVGPRLVRIPRSEVARMRRAQKQPYVNGLQRYTPLTDPRLSAYNGLQ